MKTERRVRNVRRGFCFPDSAAVLPTAALNKSFL
jgi:hypothetical protein